MNTSVLSSLMQHYFFGPGQKGTWDSTTNEIIAQFADRYNCNSTQQLHTLGRDWNLERRLDTPGFIFRITDKLTDVDDDQGRYQEVSFEVYYDRKVGNIRPGLKNNISQLIKRSGLEKTFKPDYRDEWFH
ncbi:MAG: hypothetical protein KAR20_29920 [Candidatus Heimdallarchaeota archaeon]|nr:hypothetical protein [Candidatus Heimdallarchaeota archaeon]